MHERHQEILYAEFHGDTVMAIDRNEMCAMLDINILLWSIY